MNNNNFIITIFLFTASSYAQKLQKFTIKIFDKNWKEYRIVSRIFCTMVIVTALSYASIPLIIMAYMKFTSGIVPRHHSK